MNLKRIPVLGPALVAIRRSVIAKKIHFQSSEDYWERRYKSGNNSGSGSYGRLAKFKADVINKFVDEQDVSSIVELGVGDGAQLMLARYGQASYIGIDVSPTIIEKAKKEFSDRLGFRFEVFDRAVYAKRPCVCCGELGMSLDVVYHLVEDEAFKVYMEYLFDSSMRFVIIYSSNKEELTSVPHVRHRCVTDWVAKHRPEWKLIEVIPNAYPFDGSCYAETSFADFYIFARESVGS